MSDRSAPFTEMATRIDLNAEHGYGGAFVVVPPGDDVQPVVMLILDNSGDPASFWGTVLTRCQIAIEEIKQKEDAIGGYGGMRR